MRIGLVAPSCPLDPAIPDQLRALASKVYGDAAPEFVVHDQCFLSDGHFAGNDEARGGAFVTLANDPAIDAIWFARGGYGANRIAPAILPQLTAAARAKAYIGYSDAGFLLAGLYARGIGRVAHGPIPSDLNRAGGEDAVLRSHAWLIDPENAACFAPPQSSAIVELSPPLTGKPRKCVAFNLTVFSSLIGTALQPDLTDHVLMLEDVDEHLYRIDRALFHVTSNPAIRQVAGLMLGRCDPVPPNDRPFFEGGVGEAGGEEAIAQYWCDRAGIRWLGRADIGHDVNNKVVVFG